MTSLTYRSVDSESQLNLDKELYDSALSIRNEMNLLTERIRKMEEHKTEFAEAVYIRVKSDYLAQLEIVEKKFDEKRQAIHSALRQLYEGKKTQENSIQKHREVLEEAKFRNFLGEYTDKKFKEVENREGEAIKQYEGTLSSITANIQQYEEIVGGPVEELPADPILPNSDLKEEQVSSVQNASSPDAAVETQESADLKKETSVAEFIAEESDYKIEGEENYFESHDSKVVEVSHPRLVTSKTKLKDQSENTPPLIPKLKTEKPKTAKVGHEDFEPVTGKTDLRSPPLGMGFDDSISSILRSIPLEEEEAFDSPAAEPGLSTVVEFQENAPKARLISIEGDLEPKEIILGENTSLGRSPSNDIILKEAKVSRQHAAINLIDGKYVLVDLKSSNGVFVNGHKIEEHALEPGDEISVGSCKMRYQVD